MHKRTVLFSAGAMTLLAGLLWAAEPSTQPAEKKTVTPSGLTIIEKGTTEGPTVAQAGDTVWVHYTGKLENGTKFDSSLDHPETRADGISFPLGAGRVIKGWDEGIAGMKIGDKRQLIIPPALGYGAQGAGESIPPNATLVFDVELIGLKRVAQK
jgi:FKBP-type peptidyl-prolyl cis-trans isomerase